MDLSTGHSLLSFNRNINKSVMRNFICIQHIVHGPEGEIVPPGGIFEEPHICVVWTLAFKNLVVGWKIEAVCGHNKLVSLAKNW